VIVFIKYQKNQSNTSDFVNGPSKSESFDKIKIGIRAVIILNGKLTYYALYLNNSHRNQPCLAVFHELIALCNSTGTGTGDNPGMDFW